MHASPARLRVEVCHDPGVPERDGADHGRRAHRAPRRRRAGQRRADRGRGPAPGGPRGDDRDRRDRRHRDAGHDRHAPAHVADRDARLRRGLDADPVLRLVLPAVGQDLPAAGHLRGQPAVRAGGPGRGRHHHGGLVARAADGGPRRGRGGGAHRGAGAVRAGLRQHPAGPVGVVGRPGVPRLRQPPLRRGQRHARLPDGLRRDRRPGVPGEGRVRGGPGPRRAGHHARRESGARPTTTGSGSCTSTGS